MASLTMSIIPQLRPCLIKDEKCLFHTWETYMEPLAPSPLRGGHTGGQLTYMVGWVEKEDGTMMRVLPKEVKFVDSLHFETWSGGNYTDAD